MHIYLSSNLNALTLHVYNLDLLNEKSFDFGSIKIDNIKSFYNLQMHNDVLKSSIFSDNDELTEKLKIETLMQLRNSLWDPKKNFLILNNLQHSVSILSYIVYI